MPIKEFKIIFYGRPACTNQDIKQVIRFVIAENKEHAASKLRNDYEAISNVKIYETY